MKYFKRFLWFAFALAILATLGIWVMLQKQAPKYDGLVKTLNLNQEVEVYFDAFGIPHIYAQNMVDAYQTLGYLHAQDRLFQMDLSRRVGGGRLAEVFGEDLVEVDHMFRTLGITHHATQQMDRIQKEMDPKQNQIIDAYLRGVNHYVEYGNKPVEYRLLGIDPEPFTFINMMEITGYMATSFLFTMQTDPVMDFIFANYGDSAHLAGMAIEPDEKTIIISNAKDSAYLQMAQAIRQNMDVLPFPIFQGSNSWVLGPSKSASGKVIFCNDTHMKFSQPQVWHEAHINYPGYEFYGNYLAGIPFALIGHNRELAWGLTMLENNDSDLYYETIDEEKQSYWYDSIWHPLETREEIIRVKGAEDQKFEVRSTRNGPIINDFLKVEYDTPVSMWWLYHKVKNQMVNAFYQMNYATNINEMGEAIALIHGPGLNVNYGDTNGNIAWWACAKLVKRPEGLNPLTIHDGSDPNQSIDEFWSFDSNPRSVNPSSGYIYSCNNQPDTLPDGSYIPGYFAPQNRANRLNHLIQSRDKWSVEQVKSISLDVTSPVERDINAALIALVDRDGLTNKQLEVLEWLNSWNGSHGTAEGQPVLYYRWLELLIREVYTDELGEDLLKLFASSHRGKSSYSRVFSHPGSPWWDNVQTEEKEEASKICTQTFVKAIDICMGSWGADPQKWGWGKAHQLYFEHPLGKVAALSRTFNVGPFDAPGGNETINNAGFDLISKEKTRTVTYGPQMRIILDFADTDHSLSISPTGQSGNIMSPHYRDQAHLFVEGRFRKQLMAKEELIKGKKLVFKPTSAS